MDMKDGYEILKTILFETRHGIALGYAGDEWGFAVWNFTQTGYGRDYYREAHHDSREDAEGDFRKRAECFRELYGLQEKPEGGAEYYRYYSTQRPVDIATYPQPEGNSPVIIINYNEDRRRPVVGGKLSAWGEITYSRPLTEKQMKDYELSPEPRMPDSGAKIQDFQLDVWTNYGKYQQKQHGKGGRKDNG